MYLRSFRFTKDNNFQERRCNMRRIIIFENANGTKGILKHFSHSRCIKRVEGSRNKAESIADLNWVRDNPCSWSTKELCMTSNDIFNRLPFSPVSTGID